MKCLIIGGNRFVGLRLSHLLDQTPGVELHIVNRTGQVAHTKRAVVYKADREHLSLSHLDREWDLIVDFACYNLRQAQSAIEHFTKVGRYLFVSTASVYSPGANLKEESFNAATWDLSTPLIKPDDSGAAYTHGKRQAEALFTQRAPFPTLSVRFPFILGPDDYTHRLDFHLERTLAQKPIHITNPRARFSVIHSQDAAQFLKWATQQNLSGPLNVASPTPISVTDILAQITLIHNRDAKIAAKDDGENHSPYSRENDWFLNVDKMQKSGFAVRPVREWLAELLGQPDLTTSRPGYVH